MTPDTLNLEPLKVLIGAFGGSGIAFFVAWVVFLSWKEALKQKDDILTARIEALERATAECSRDRSALHGQLYELQRGVIASNTEVMHKVLHQLKPMAAD